MLNILSYLGMSLHSEVCLWTLLGLVRTIFDATLFKVNANLKQVWQMTMPPELSLPVQRMLRSVISGVMLVQCFTVYVYLASYIVLLYPVFLEERPTLVLPWLLLAAIRKLLCELTSLALGLGTCLMLGAARPPCIRFVILKAISIMPAFYMWMLIYSYYDSLKVASVFKTFSISYPDNDDYGLELAIRRRRTKSLLGEAQLRKLVIPFNAESSSREENRAKLNYHLYEHCDDASPSDTDNVKGDYDNIRLSATSHRNISDIGCYEDWFGSEVRVPRDTDRIHEQFIVMMLRIGAYLKKYPSDAIHTFPESQSFLTPSKYEDINCTALPSDETDTPTYVGNSKINMSSYLQEYPQIFNKKYSEIRLRLRSEDKISSNLKDEKDDRTLKCNFSAVTDDNISLQSKTNNIGSSKAKSISKASVLSQKTKQEKYIKMQNNVKSEPIEDNSEKNIKNHLSSCSSSNTGLLLNTQSLEGGKMIQAEQSSETLSDSLEKKTTSSKSTQNKK